MKESISEKEFLIKYTDAYLRDRPGPVEPTIDKFLTEFHKEYYEVEFVRCRAKTEIYANEISDIDLVRDDTLQDDTFIVKVDDKIVHVFKLNQTIEEGLTRY